MNRIDQFIIAINSFSVGIMLPVFNLALLDRGATLQTLPLVVAIYSATVMCLELPSGILADMHGRREVFLMSCGFQFTAYCILLAADSLLWLVFFAIFHGMVRAFSSGSLEALFIDQAILENGEGCLAKVTSRMALLDGVGLALGGMAGGFLAGMAEGYMVNIVLRMTISIALFVMVVFFVKEPPAHESKGQISLKTHIRQGKQVICSTPGFPLLFIGVFLTGVFLSVIETYWQPAFMQLPSAGDSTWLLGFITFLGFMAVAAGNIAVKKLLDKYSHNWWGIYNLCRIIFGASIVVLAVQKGSPGFILCYAAVYLLLGAGNVAESTLINKLTPGSMRASILSLSSLTLQIGALCASIFSSIMILRLGFTGVCLLAGLLVGVYAAAVALVSNIKKRNSINKIDFES